MTDIRIKRRVSGVTGAPSALKTAELAWNMADADEGILYGGYGDDGEGDATSVVALGGSAKADADHTHSLSDLTVPTGNISFDGYRITNLAAPTANSDAATKAYVDGISAGLDFKESCRAATTANITLSGEQTIDGVSVVAGDRVLVKNQTSGSANGIYIADASTWSRATDFDNDADVSSGALTFVEEGTAGGGKQFVLTTTGAITLGTTSLTFSVFGGGTTYTAGDGLVLSSSEFSVQTVDSGRITVGASGIDLATTAVSPGTYKSVTVDTYGRVTAGTSPTTLAGYGITDAQGLDATLTALAGVTVSADQVIYADGADSFATAALTAFARTLLDDADAATARGTLGLGTMATQAANAVAITGGTIDGVTIDSGTVDGGTF